MVVMSGVDSDVLSEEWDRGELLQRMGDDRQKFSKVRTSGNSCRKFNSYSIFNNLTFKRIFTSGGEPVGGERKWRLELKRQKRREAGSAVERLERERKRRESMRREAWILWPEVKNVVVNKEDVVKKEDEMKGEHALKKEDDVDTLVSCPGKNFKRVCTSIKSLFS